VPNKYIQCKMEEEHDESRTGVGGQGGTLVAAERRRLIRFSGELRGKGEKGVCERLANAARVHVEDIRGIVLSTPPTHHFSSSLLVSSTTEGAKGMRQTKELWRNCIRALRPRCCII